MLSHAFKLKMNSDSLIQMTISKMLGENYSPVVKEDVYQSFELISISMLSKIDFKSMDKEFKKIGKVYLDAIQKFQNHASVDERDLIYDSFSTLVLNNKEFSNTELFPNKNAQMIQNKLQVWMLMNGMHFLLLPNSMKSSLDLTFYFK
jgi:hypothetical protein